MTSNNTEFGINPDNTTSTETGPGALDDVISNEVFNIVVVICNVFIVPIVSVFGTFGNLVTMIVLFRLGFKDTTNILLFSLAICDFSFLFLLCVRKVETFLSFVDEPLSKAYSAYCQVYLFSVSRTILAVSIVHIAFIASERFIAVFFPFKVSVWITPRRLVIALVLLYLTIFIACLPQIGLRYKLVMVFDPVANTTVPREAITDLYKENGDVIENYIAISMGGLVGLGSVGFVSIGSAAVGFKLAQANKKQKAMTTQSTSKAGAQRVKALKVSRMLLTVCIVFITTNIPTIFFVISFFTGDGQTVLSSVFKLLVSITEACNAINSSANFVIYIFLASKFCSTLKEIMCC